MVIASFSRALDSAHYTGIPIISKRVPLPGHTDVVDPERHLAT
jgi:hypothetical protein